MQSVLVWTGGFAGLAAFIVFTVAAIIAVAAQYWDRATLFAALAVAGLWGAAAANKRIEQLRRDRAAQRAREAATWSGNEFTAGLRWGFWIFATGIALALTVAGVLLVSSSKPLFVIVGALLALPSALIASGTLRLAVAAAGAGYLLRMDPLGIHHCCADTIAWRDVLAVDLKKVQVNNQAYYLLVLALRPDALAERRAGILRWIHWMRPRVVGSGLEITLGLADADPEVIAQAARVIGGRAGVPLTSGWFYGSDVSLALQRSQAMQDWSDAMSRSSGEAMALVERAKRGELRPDEIDKARERMQQAGSGADEAQDRLRRLNTSFLQEQRTRIAAANRVLYAMVAVALAFAGYSVWTKVSHG